MRAITKSTYKVFNDNIWHWFANWWGLYLIVYGQIFKRLRYPESWEGKGERRENMGENGSGGASVCVCAIFSTEEKEHG